MFDKAIRLWERIRNMFGYTELKSVAGKEISISKSMIEAIESWKAMLAGKAPWAEGYVKSLGIESGICREFADASLVEMETSVNNEELNEIYQKAILNLNENLQEGLGLGSFVLRPVAGSGTVEYIAADKIVPISFDGDGRPLDIGFLSVKKAGQMDYYIRFERHYFVNGSLTIENKCYHSQSERYIGSPCELTDVPEWASINPGPVTYPGMTQMDFGYYRNPVKNKIDGSKCGVSIFESAKGSIEKADIQGARLDWEYESGERAIHIDDRALKNKKHGRKGMAKLNNRLYRGLNLEDGKDKELLKEYSPEMRDEAFSRGLEKYYRNIEFNVGLAYGDLSDVREVEKTAAEVKVSKVRKYNRVTAIQGKLKECLEGLASGLAFYNNLYRSGYELSCKFNDSILTDEETERQQDRQDVAMGVMQLWEYRMKWYNEDEETAKANLPEQNTVQE